MLQQHFNANTFKIEQKIYRAEQIAFEPVVFIDNKPMIDLITKKPNGILPLLDEELIVPEGMQNHSFENEMFYTNTCPY